MLKKKTPLKNNEVQTLSENVIGSHDNSTSSQVQLKLSNIEGIFADDLDLADGSEDEHRDYQNQLTPRNSQMKPSP